MKIYIAVFCLVFCLTSTFNFAQSRRAAPEPEKTQKVNQRPPQTAAAPKPPANIEEDEPNTTNIERIAAPVEAAAADDGDVIKVETEIVSVPVKISDRKGRFIGGLTKENFQIFEDGVPQEIEYFSNEQQPFTVALVLDMSYSAKFKAPEIQQAALTFISQLRENDRVMVVSFDEQVYVHTEPTSDRQALQRAVKSTKIGYGTSLYEAVDLVINQKFRRINGRKAIVLFSDGVDTTSRRAHDLNNLSDALELDALVYPIQYDTFAAVQAMKNKPVISQPTIPSPIPTQNKSPFPFPLPTGGTGGVGTMDAKGTSVEEYRKADEYLNEMANRTGGRLFQADSIVNLERAFSNIAAELREYYSLGYYPKDAATAGKKHKIKVRVNQPPNAVVRARDSYVVGKKEKKDK